MAKVCENVNELTNQCLIWVDHVSLLDQLAITKAEMVMIASPIIGIYGLIIAFVLFNNFVKRV